MTLDEAITDLQSRIQGVSPDAVIRVTRISAEEARLRAYAPADHDAAIREATQQPTIDMLINDGLDIQVLVYNIETDLPPEESA
jgi:hypothetical protein